MSWDQRSEDELLRAAVSEPAAFAAFYRRLERRVLGFFARATGRGELAADLAAETFARALESVADFDDTRGHADQWLFGIARHVLAASYRRGRVEDLARRRLEMPRLALDDEAIVSIERLADERGAAVLALAELPGAQRDAVRGHVVDERPYAEIAGELRCSEAVVRQRVSRGLKTLRNRLERER